MVDQLNLEWLLSKTLIIYRELITLSIKNRKKNAKKTKKYDIFAIISKNKRFRPIVPLKVE